MNRFEVRWVIVEGDPNKYRDWLEQTEQVLEARKRLHNFQQREEPGEKSTISGERQALCWSSKETASGRHQVRAFWEALTTRRGHPNPKEYRSLSAKEISLDGSERLDAIDTIKRFATKSRSSEIGEQPFPSTSSITTASFVEGLLSPELDQASLQIWLTATNGPFRDIPEGSTRAIPYLAKAKRDNEILRRDGDCFFHATFTPHRLKKDYGIADEAQARKLANDGMRGLERLLEATDKVGLRRPTPYYAIVKMDGDRIGTLLNTATSIGEHQKISGALSKFTNQDVSELVNENYPGRLVYAGGDDVLALVPLARNLPQGSEGQSEAIKTVIDLADQLQRQYRERMKRVERDVTASISIAIAHHYTPLSFVLGVMRRAERQLAKKRYGRNALVVSLIRHSGAQTEVGCRWEYPASEGIPEVQPISLFSRFYELFEKNILSPKCAHILLDEAPALVGLEPVGQSSEIRRVLLRQRSESKSNELPDEEAKKLAERLTWLAKAMNKAHSFTGKSTRLEDGLRDGLVEALGWLLAMAFLTRKEAD